MVCKKKFGGQIHDGPVFIIKFAVFGQLRQTSPRRLARRDSAHRSDGEFPREPPDEQIPADAMDPTRRRPPAAGSAAPSTMARSVPGLGSGSTVRCSNPQMALAA